MNKFLIAIILYAFISIVEGVGIYAQVDVNKVGQTGMKFLSVPVGARNAAMGDAISALSNNSESVFFNPAGISEVKENYDFSLGYNNWIADIKHHYLSFVYNTEKLGAFCISALYIDYGTIEGTIRSDIDPKGYIETGNFSPKSFSVGVSYSKAINEKFSFGVTAKFVRQDFGAGYIGVGKTTEEVARVSHALGMLALDVGTIYKTGFKDLRIALAITNISAEGTFIRESTPLPFTLTLSVGANLFKSFEIKTNDELNLAIEVQHPRDYSERTHWGLEYVYNSLIAMRVGYKTNYDENNLSAGLGILWNGYRVDYAYNPFGRLTAVHRVSLGFQL